MRNRPHLCLLLIAVITAAVFAFAASASALNADNNCSQSAPAEATVLCGHLAHDASHSSRTDISAVTVSFDVPVASLGSATLIDRPSLIHKSPAIAPLLQPPQLIR